MRVLIFIVTVFIGFVFTYFQYLSEGNLMKSVCIVVSTLALATAGGYLLPLPFDSNKDKLNVEQTSSESIGSKTLDDNSINDLQVSERNTDVENENYIEDVSEKSMVSGSISEKNQVDSYRYVAQISGVYRFDVDLSSGSEVCIYISGENNETIGFGYNGLTIELEACKKYILSVEYQNGVCDYIVNIGVPIAIIDISSETEIIGSITYKDKKDRYLYTAPRDGAYRFDTDLSAGGSVVVRISGENGNVISYNYDGLTIDLEAGKTYILSIEYRNGVCDYSVSIGVPKAINYITTETAISGSIEYKDQKDLYSYTAPRDGTYRFDTNLSAGGSVVVRISGENGNVINYAYDGLTIELETGKTYILSIEYRNAPCDYIVSIGVPIEIKDISTNSVISGSIIYKNQIDKYIYTAPFTEKYRFDTNLSAGGSVKVCISGENGRIIKYNYDCLTVDLEEGKTYLLSIEYRNSLCTYEVYIGLN